ncbi:hypothetical protein D9619_009438 [Psilocybe cf. subviscida]|uniref:F-box domain-containing protein n=1 Tax=Psilocybe cf. subviscida TaxID=2480587 RepID=A0A8H5BTW0_9AGAR|nr:hypothetical protein D9619_009438 [Psilocybe cf. subviscida]
MATSFPVELWARVASLISRPDLMNLALVSRLHLDISRRIFCQEVTLDMTRFRLLENGEYDRHEVRNYIIKYNLSTAVQEIVVWGYATKPALDKLLEVTPGLRSLSMIIAGCQVFLASAKAQQKFVRLLKRSCPSLEEFRLNAAAHLKDNDFAIPNLKTVKWKEFGRVSPAFVSLCRASLSTLTEISLAIHDGAYTEFFRLCFPSLLRFKIGPGHAGYGRNATRAKAISSGLTSFLVAHPSIENLNLAYQSVTDINRAIYISLRPKLLTPDMLPNVKTLHAHPNQVSQLATANAEFLSSLKTLSISNRSSSGGQGYAYDFSGMLEKLAAKGPLFARHLVTTVPYGGTRAENFASDMRKVAEAFPELETWVGSSPGKCTVEQLAETFSQLPRLREISYDIVSSSSEQYTIEKVRIIAERCPLLARFVWRDTRPPTQFTVARPAHNQIAVSSAPLVMDEGRDAEGYHADSDADNDEPRSDDEWPDEDDDDSEDGEDVGGQDGAGNTGVDDNGHDMSDGFGSDQEGGGVSKDED